MLKWLPGGETGFLLAAVLVVPAVLARYLIGAPWLQVCCAFLVWYLGLWSMLGGTVNPRGESFGWTVILSMFFSWAGVPIVALVLRLLNVPYRFL